MPRILILDDDPRHRRTLARALVLSGYSVEESPSGRGVSELAHAREIDLVITDILMPDRDGLEVILDLKRSDPGIPIIALSERVEDQNYLSTAQALGAAAIFYKDTSPAVITQTIQALLGQRASEGSGVESERDATGNGTESI